MSWSSSMIQDDLNNSSVTKIKIQHNNKSYNAILEMHQEDLDEENFFPFYIYGKNLNLKPDQKIKIHNFEATIESDQFNDGIYQVWNIMINPIFNENDFIKDTITKAKYKITKRTRHYYKALNADNEEVIIPFIYQHLAKKI